MVLTLFNGEIVSFFSLFIQYKYSKSQKSVSATLLVKLGKTVIKPEKSDVSGN